MNHEQMKQRCQGSKYIKRGYLQDYKFVYDGYSSIRSGAVANIVESNSHVVWGGVFEIGENDLAALDSCEGYPSSYNRKEVMITDDDRNTYKAMAYYRTNKKIGIPTKEYRQIVLKGAADCHLPEDYITSYS